MAWVEGLRGAAEAIRSGSALRVVVAPDLLRNDFARSLVEQCAEAEVLHVTAAAFRRISIRDRPVGLAVVARERWQRLDAITVRDLDYWVAVSRSDNPGNLGCIIRTAVAARASGVVILDGAADPYHVEALRAAVGATFRMPLIECGIEELAAWAGAHDVLLVGVTPDGRSDYRRWPVRSPSVLMVGSEREGIDDRCLAACAATVRIPMSAEVDSLNVCVAAGLVLYEILRHPLHPCGGG
jgi:TrmH family RNA methyltransferase